MNTEYELEWWPNLKDNNIISIFSCFFAGGYKEKGKYVYEYEVVLKPKITIVNETETSIRIKAKVELHFLPHDKVFFKVSWKTKLILLSLCYRKVTERKIKQLFESFRNFLLHTPIAAFEVEIIAESRL